MRRRRNENVLPTIRVELRDAKDLNVNGESALRYVIRLKGEGKICRATGLTIKPALWNSKKQSALGNSESVNRINKVISCKKADFETYFLKLSALDNRITIKLVSEYFHDKRFDSLFGYFDVLLKERTKVNERSTIVKDNVCRRRFESFATTRGYKNLKFADVNLAFLTDYDKHLIYSVGLQSNSSRNDHKVLKVLFKSAVVNEILDRSPYLGFKPIKTKTGKLKDVLISEEVQKLRDVDLCSEELEHLDKTRKVFLFMLNTGLRFSDVANAKLKNIRNENVEDLNIFILDVIQKKTKKSVDVVLNREALNMIHGVRQNLNDKQDPKLFGRMTLQPTNRNLKALAKEVGIEKNLSTHVARHTFATYLFNDLEIPLDLVTGGMGHSKSAMTRQYIRSSNVKLASKIDQLYVLKKGA